jgi:hypothetical protein
MKTKTLFQTLPLWKKIIYKIYDLCIKSKEEILKPICYKDKILYSIEISFRGTTKHSSQFYLIMISVEEKNIQGETEYASVIWYF